MIIISHSVCSPIWISGMHIMILSCSFKRMNPSSVSEKFLNTLGISNIFSKNESSLYQPFTSWSRCSSCGYVIGAGRLVSFSVVADSSNVEFVSGVDVEGGWVLVPIPPSVRSQGPLKMNLSFTQAANSAPISGRPLSTGGGGIHGQHPLALGAGCW